MYYSKRLINWSMYNTAKSMLGQMMSVDEQRYLTQEQILEINIRLEQISRDTTRFRELVNMGIKEFQKS